MGSSYVCAGFETLSSILDHFMNGAGECFNDNFTREDINRFFTNSCDKYLHSFGQNFRNKKSYLKYNQSEANLMTKCRNTNFFKDSLFYLDSGGFQISIGLLNRNESDILVDLYYTFLQEHGDCIDRAFIVDVCPAPPCQIFQNFDDVYKWNLDSYRKAANLPDEIRKKIIYIQHFRTPKVWDIFTKILDEEGMFEKFELFSTGGIVANLASDVAIPCIIYTIPLIPLLKRTIKHGRKSLYFHILGGATYRDVFFYEIIKLHVKKVFDIDLQITFDSSGLFKGLMVGRYLSLINHNNKISKLDIRENTLGNIYNHSGKTINEVYFNLLNDMAKRHGIKGISSPTVYDQQTGTFYNDVRVYSFLYMLDFYKVVEDRMALLANQVYSYYESGDIEKFSSSCEEITRNINSGKITKKQNIKTHSVLNSLNMINNLDEEYCKYLVNKHLAKDELTSLLNGHKDLTI